jgi:hypothetical protein
MRVSGARAGHSGRSAGGMDGVTLPWRAGWTVQVRTLDVSSVKVDHCASRGKRTHGGR